MTKERPNLEALKNSVLEARGYWHPFHEGLLQLDPAYLRAYLEFQDAPARSGILPPKVREFVYIAADGAVSHLYVPGLARHIEMALEKGASSGEVMEVIQLTMLTTFDSFEAGMDALALELAARGHTEVAATDSELRARHEQTVGYWPAFADQLARHAPHLLEPLLAYETLPYSSGHLEPKVREFVRIAVHASPVGPQPIPLRRAVGRALDAGATATEISEVLQLTSAIAVHTCTFAIPALHAAVTAQQLAEAAAPTD